MSKITAQAPSPPPVAEETARKESPSLPSVRKSPLRQLLAALASLRLTVILFAFAILIVFFGTLAQVDAGIWTVVHKYFRSAYIWVPLQIFSPRSIIIPPEYGFPFPGGWLIGGLLFVNLLAAHAVRFKIIWKRSGILLIHSGLIVMMLGELITGLFAVESQMAIDEGKSSNFVVHQRDMELAIIDPADPKNDDVVVVPASLLRKGGTIQNAVLPFDIAVARYMINSSLVRLKDAPADVKNLATAGVGTEAAAMERPEESGTSKEQTIDTPAAYLTLKKKDGSVLGTYLFAMMLPEPQPVRVGGKTYEMVLRQQRTYLPYSLQLLEFRFDRYPGTNKPKNYSSKVQLIDPEHGENREVLIRMNEPLRYRGLTFFQADFDKKTEKTTFLQVVRNPGWELPYISCVMVAVGMLIHFGIGLVGFLRKQLAMEAAS